MLEQIKSIYYHFINQNQLDLHFTYKKKQNPDIQLIAHNGYNFDFKFIYKQMIEYYGGRLTGTFNSIK